MDERRLESGSGHTQAMADRAGAYLHGRARDLSEQVERLTGRSMASWTRDARRDARRYVQQHPLRSVALTIGLGFVLGKILARD